MSSPLEVRVTFLRSRSDKPPRVLEANWRSRYHRDPDERAHHAVEMAPMLAVEAVFQAGSETEAAMLFALLSGAPSP